MSDVDETLPLLEQAASAAAETQLRLWEASTSLSDSNPLASELVLQAWADAKGLRQRLDRLCYLAMKEAEYDVPGGEE